MADLLTHSLPGASAALLSAISEVLGLPFVKPCWI